MIQTFTPTRSLSTDGREMKPVQWNWVTLIGPDACDFLHRTSTIHVQSLKVGQGQSGFFLTPQGKIRAYFQLWRFGPQEFAFEFESGEEQKWKNELLQTIDQYTFGEKMSIADATPSLESRWIFVEEAELKTVLEKIGTPDLKPNETQAIEEEIRICYRGSQQFGKPWLSVWGRPARLSQWIELLFPSAVELSLSELESWRIQSLQPRVDLEMTENSIPLELGLRNSIADQKGCYPGQEVIEKIISLGSPPRRLALIQGEGATPSPGQRLVNLATPPIEVGQVTSVTSPSPGKFTALGIIKKIHAKSGLEVKIDSSPESHGTILQITES